MLTEHVFFALFFKFLNCALFFALLYYVFRRYFLESIKQGIASKKRYSQELDNNYHVLREQQEKITQEIAAQAHESEYLLSKIKNWHESVAQEENQKRKLNDYYHEQKKKLEKIQQEYLYFKAVSLMVLPEAVAKARHDLQRDFEDTKTNHAFVNDIITQLQKNYL